MKTWLRAILAVLSTVGAYFFYIYIPQWLLEQSISDEINLFNLATLELGSFDDLFFYIQSVGYIIVGAKFAHTFAPKNSHVKAIWRLLRVFLKIIFWSLFLFVDFNTINIGADTPFGVIDALVDIRVLFWVMMGGTIFDMILAIFDFLIAFIVPKDETQGTSRKAKPAKVEGL